MGHPVLGLREAASQGTGRTADDPAGGSARDFRWQVPRIDRLRAPRVRPEERRTFRVTRAPVSCLRTIAARTPQPIQSARRLPLIGPMSARRRPRKAVVHALTLGGNSLRLAAIDQWSRSREAIRELAGSDLDAGELRRSDVPGRVPVAA